MGVRSNNNMSLESFRSKPAARKTRRTVPSSSLLLLFIKFAAIASTSYVFLAYQMSFLGECGEINVKRNSLVEPSTTMQLRSRSKNTDNDDGVFQSEWPPLKCSWFLKQIQQNHEDTNEGKLYARLVETEQSSFWISLHNQKLDAVRWEMMQSGEYYETALTQIFEQILNKAPAHARVVDVGGNIGWFTFLSASMGHHVDVFEPLLMNLIRLCQSSELNHRTTSSDIEIVDRKDKHGSINVYPFGISNRETSATMVYRQNNPGSATFSTVGPKQFQQKEVVDEVPLRSLDDVAVDRGWIDSTNLGSTNNHSIAILKIDVEGSEELAIAGAQRLLRSGIVQNLLLEATGKSDTQPIQEMLESIIYAGYKLVKFGGFKGPTKDPEEYMPMEPVEAQAQFLVEQLLTKVGKPVNFWFQRGHVQNAGWVF